MFASIPSATLFAADGHPVRVEVSVTKGLPGTTLVGRPDASIREARDRVRAALLSIGIDPPGPKITINLAPTSDRKTGSSLDVAIAIGILAAAGEIPPESVRDLGFVGELGLDGSLRAVHGIAPMVGAIDTDDVVVPIAGAVEARLVARGQVRLIADLGELVAVLRGDMPWPDHDAVVRRAPPPTAVADLADVRGQPVARHALEVAAAGGHHMLFIGPPGAGKTMLASRLPGLLPDLDPPSALQVTMVHSAAGIPLPPDGLVRRPPYRSPHHSASLPAIVGGGSQAVRPGEVSLASGGVLFLDELAEFAPSVLDGLRQPLEERVVHVVRTDIRAVMPADFLLVAAMNPCPCGGGGAPGDCVCGDALLQRYTRRVSGPLLDRFDLRVPVYRPGVDDLLSEAGGEPTAPVATRVAAARAMALERQGCVNRELGTNALDVYARPDVGAMALLRHELENDRLSGRGYHRIRRVARTIADLRGEPEPTVLEHDVALALRFRASLGRARSAGRVA